MDLLKLHLLRNYLLRLFIFYCILSLARSSVQYDKITFAENVPITPHFVMFFAPWCGHCKRLTPTWEDLSSSEISKMVKIAKVDCTLEKELCNQEEVTGYPTLRFYAGEASDSSEEVTGGVKYQGKRDLDSLETWLRDKVEQRMVSRSETTTAKPSDKASLEVKKEVRDLNAETFHGTLSEGSHFVEFFAPWCGHCQRLHPVWESLGLSENVERSGTSIGRVDCTSQRDVCKEVGVAGYPTLIFFREGVRIEEYNGGRSLSELEAYVDKMSSMGGKSYNAEQLADVTTSPSGALVRFFDRGSWVMEWMRLAQQAKSVGLRIAEVDCALSPGECESAGKTEGNSSLLVLYESGKAVRSLSSLKETVDSAWEKLRAPSMPKEEL